MHVWGDQGQTPTDRRIGVCAPNQSAARRLHGAGPWQYSRQAARERQLEAFAQRAREALA